MNLKDKIYFFRVDDNYIFNSTYIHGSVRIDLIFYIRTRTTISNVIYTFKQLVTVITWPGVTPNVYMNHFVTKQVSFISTADIFVDINKHQFNIYNTIKI